MQFSKRLHQQLRQMAYESEKGALQLMPQAASRTLDLSIFEIVEVLSTAIMRPLYDWIRLLLLINVELDEETRDQAALEDSALHRHLQIHTCAHIYIYVCIYVYACVYVIHTHTHTYTCTYTNWYTCT